MIHLEHILQSIGNVFKQFNLVNIKSENLTLLDKQILVYIQFSSACINISLLLLIILTVLNIIYNFFFKNFSNMIHLLRAINLFFLASLTTLFFVKFYYSLRLEQILGPHLLDLKLKFFTDNNSVPYLEYYGVFSSSFSDAVVILALITGIICLELLGLKNIFKNINNVNIFFIFLSFVIIMVSSNNILIVFICFEFLFLPTMYFVHKLGYSKKIDKANEILFYWTLFGSFLVLCALIYIYTGYNTLNYNLLQQKQFSYLESKILFFVFLLGFGIKIPLAPFHYWLLKVHVESPTAFSIFLSGFLVKSALYCLFILLSIFHDVNNFFFLTIWILISLVVATLGLGRQTDFKKLIAWATVQEMTFMLLFLIFKQIFLMHICTLFLLLHGIMSTYMFYIVDMLYRRFKTRGLVYIKGLHLLLPKLTKHFWFLILLFSGFPLTAKFLIEWGLISLMTNTYFGALVYIILIVNFLGSILFCKIMFSIIYGVQEDKEFEFIETQKKEYSLLNFLVILILLLIWLMYTF